MESTTSVLLGKARTAEKSWPAVLAELTKAGLTGLVLLTTAAGFYAGSKPGLNWAQLLHTLAGTALLAAGAAALNQYLERDADARMRRTAHRPLPAGRLQPETVLGLGTALATAGILYLGLAVNGLTCLLGLGTLLAYLLVYTPLKKRTVWNTWIGAVPGALPALMGWAAARGDLSLPGWAWFAVLFFWQIPHFMAISWMHREDYRRGGFVMLASQDADGRQVGRLALLHAAGLLAVSLGLTGLGLGGPVYAVGASLSGLIMVAAAAAFARQRTERRARQLFWASIAHLPLLMGLLVWDKPLQAELPPVTASATTRPAGPTPPNQCFFHERTVFGI